MPVQTDEDAHLCGQPTREEMADDAREHYERLSLEAHCWYSVIPSGINAWEREPELLERIAEKEEELERLRKKHEVRDKHSPIRIPIERNNLGAEVARLREDNRARHLLWDLQKEELEINLIHQRRVIESLRASIKVMTRQLGEVRDIIRNTPIIEIVRASEHLWEAIPRWTARITIELLVERKCREETEEILAQFFAEALDLDMTTEQDADLCLGIHNMLQAMKEHPTIQRVMRT